VGLGFLLSFSLHSNNITNKDRNTIVEIAKSYDGTKEIGKNRGVAIDKFNKFNRVALGSPYCASFCSYVLDSANKIVPIKYKVKSALAMKLRNKKTYSAKEVLNGKKYPKASEIIVWQKGKTVFGHAGFVTKDWIGISGESIQANTNKSKESRDGNGIYIKKAKIEPFNYFRIVAFTPVL
jgi:hypothetical protein